MGGSGGGGYGTHDVNTEALRQQVRRDLQRQEFLVEVNRYLGDQLSEFNDRDTDAVGSRLDQIASALGDEVEGFDRLLFGGSIAKHTYVDGLSDVDALVIVGGDRPGDPGELIARFAQTLERALLRGTVTSVTPGALAVTVTYADGVEIQLLPARQRGGTVSIASEDGRGWRDIRPRKFAEKLTEVNGANNGAVVPAIKLAKGAIGQLPDRDRLTGYHIEAIAVDAFRSYEGSVSRDGVLRHLLDHAATAVLRPTGDITGQSVHLDDHLGPANSPDRQRISASLGRIVSKMDSATSVEDYKEIFGD